MIVTGYQTLQDRDNIDAVEADGPFPCRRQDAWLSFGYYFWDTNMKWAIDWGEKSYVRNGLEYIIAKCDIDLTHDCFDLFGSVADKMEFMRIVEVLNKSGKLKPHHRVTVPNIIRYMESQGIFPFKSVRAADYPDMHVRYYYSDKPDKKEFTFLNQRVQICVKKKNGVLLQPFKVVFPEKYLD